MAPAPIGARAGKRPLERLDFHGSALVDRPAGIVGDLPHVAFGIGERPGDTTPVRTGGRAYDRATRSLGLCQDGLDLLGGANIVRQLDPGGTVAAKRSPESEHHPARLKEADLVVRLLSSAPPE